MTTHVVILNRGPGKVKVTTLTTGYFAGTKSIIEHPAPRIVEPGQFVDVAYVHSSQELLISEIPE